MDENVPDGDRLGSEGRDSRFTVAVVGAGPAGIYVADALLRATPDASVDIFERLPAPYGLLRYGVAPDHVRMKSLEKVLKKTLSDRRVTLVGGVEVGQDVATDELVGSYHAVVWCIGANDGGVPLGVPGEDSTGVLNSAQFVGWYNGHPDHPERVDLSGAAAAVVGAGNVALDVARLLCSAPEVIADTDVPRDVLEAFRGNQIGTVHLLCRGRPSEVKFSRKELRELVALDGVDVAVHPSSSALVAGDERLSAHPCGDLIRGITNQGDTSSAVPARKQIWLHFKTEVLSCEGPGSLRALRISGPEGTARVEVQLLVTCVGYQSRPVAKEHLVEGRRMISNVRGRLVDSTGEPVVGQYVSGWAKRGPAGVLGTNRPDAEETVTSVLEDLELLRGRQLRGQLTAERLQEDGTSLNFARWCRIEAEELRQGRAAGRPRVKLATWDELRAAALTSEPSNG